MKKNLKGIYQKLLENNELDMIMPSYVGIWEEDKLYFEDCYNLHLDFITNSDDFDVEDIFDEFD